MVVAIGGNLGLFLGFSLLSIIETIAKYIHALWCKYYRKKSQQECRRISIKTFDGHQQSAWEQNWSGSKQKTVNKKHKKRFILKCN